VMHWFGKPDNSARIRVVAPFAPVLQIREARLKPDSVQLQPLPGAPFSPI
jgi:hypothetical protein